MYNDDDKSSSTERKQRNRYSVGLSNTLAVYESGVNNMPKFIDLTGRKFGRLTVIECAGKNKHNQYQWLCECDCEKHTRKVVSGGNLKQGYVRSCGCLIENCYTSNLKHGLSRSRINITYKHMKDRCLNPNSQYFSDYGGRGITVCEEWLGEEGFSKFLKWANENGYADDLTLDRIDVNGNYEPSNCRWTTVSVQNNNKRNNHYLTIDGVTKTIKQWCEIYGICQHTFYYRVRKLKMNEIDAMTTPKTSGGVYGSRIMSQSISKGDNV